MNSVNKTQIKKNAKSIINGKSSKFILVVINVKICSDEHFMTNNIRIV